jgi:hypothetical protein
LTEARRSMLRLPCVWRPEHDCPRVRLFTKFTRRCLSVTLVSTIHQRRKTSLSYNYRVSQNRHKNSLYYCQCFQASVHHIAISDKTRNITKRVRVGVPFNRGFAPVPSIFVLQSMRISKSSYSFLGSYYSSLDIRSFS